MDVVWDLDDDLDGNVHHIADHGLTKSDVEIVLRAPLDESVSRSSGRSMRFGHTASGKYIAVVYEPIDEFQVYPVTAYEVPEPGR